VRISVVVIAKNAEKTIAKCLSSIVEQTLPAHEIIVVDGRSKDKTREIASKFPVKLIVAPKRDTYGVSRNLGVKAATGDVIAFLDADDYAESSWLENAVKHFSRTDVGAVNSKQVYVYPHNWFTKMKWDKTGKKSFSPSEESWMSPGPSGSVIRKKLIEKAGYFDEDMFFGSEGQDLMLRIASMGYRIVSEPNALIYFTPSTSAKEWIVDAFFRHGIGHGTIKRRYGKYAPPTKIPLITATVIMAFLIISISGLWHLLPLLLVVVLLGIMAETYSSYQATKRLMPSLKYVLAFIAARDAEFLGFLVGYVVPSKVLRKIARR